MGTNYYWHYNKCDCCGRYDVRHICKSLITFRGYFQDSEWNDQTRQWEETPIIASWQNWVATFMNIPGEIWDEYGKQHNIEEFIANVDATDKASRRRQYDWMVQHGYTIAISSDGDWLDPDGFSFSGREFS